MDKSNQLTIPEKSTSKDVSPTATVVGDLEKNNIQLTEGKPIKGQDSASYSSSTAANDDAVDFEPLILPTAVRIPMMIGLCLVLFLAGLDNTISATAMPKIASQFNDLNEVGWIATAYILTFNAFLPLVGRFAEVFGRRPVILVGLAVFLVGSALCGAATSMKVLILMRAVQGIGGGAVFGCILIVFADISSLKDRAKYQALVAVIFSIASVLGPLIGGAFVDNVTWRWGFYLNLPVGALATLLIIFALKLPPVKGSLMDKLKRLDYIGTALVVSAVVVILLAVTWGGSKYAWNSPTIIVLFVLFGLFVIGLVVYEVKYAIEPIIPPHLFKIRTAVAVYIGAPFFVMAFFSLMYFLPIFWQVAKHSSATMSGLRLVPITVGLFISANIAAYLAPRLGGVRELMMAGAAFGTIATGLVSLYKEDDNLGMEIGFLLIFGFGLGILWSLGVVAVQSATETKDLAAATSLVNFFQMLGGAIGVAISSSVFFNHLHNELVQILPMEQVMAAQNSVAFVHSLPDDVQSLVIHAYVISLKQVWYVQCALAGISFIAVLFVKNYPLKKDENVAIGGGL